MFLERMRELMTAWQGADACLKVLIGVVFAFGAFGWICAIVECTGKRKVIAEFMNITGWKIK